MKKMNWLLLATLALSLPAFAQEERLTPPPEGGFPEVPGPYQGRRVIGGFNWVDPKGTYLKVTQPTNPNPATVVPLNGIPAGTLLRMKEVGSFSSFPGQPDDVSVGLTGVFVDAGGRFLSPGPFTSARDSVTDADIRQDFLLGLPFETRPFAQTVQVPYGAVAILFTPGNGYIYWDNDDPNGNYGVLIAVAGSLEEQTLGLEPCDSCNPNIQSYPNPVNIVTGQMWHPQTDFVIPGRTPETALRVHRTYKGTRSLQPGRFGHNWHDSYETRLVPAGGGGRFDIHWIDENGGAYTFLIQPDNTYLAPAGTRIRLLDAGDHYELRKPGNTVLHFSKSPFGRLTKLVERHGEEMTFSYDGAGRLETVASPMAGSITYSYNARNLVEQVTRSRDNLFHTYQYNADDRLIAVTDFGERTYQYTYVANQPNTEAQDKLETITDPIGRVLTFSYDRIGRITSVIEPGNAAYTYAYGDLSTSVRLPNGEVMQHYFDENFRTIKEVFPDGARKTHTWVNGDRVATLEDYGGTTQFEYDENKNVIGVKRPEDPGFSRVTYDLNFDQPTLITPLAGAPTLISLNPMTGDVMQVSRAGLSLTFTRDAFGNLLSTNNGRAIYTDVRNANGQITTKFDLHNPETRTYDARNRLATRQYLSGRTLTYEYNDYDQMTRIVDSHGPDVIQVYDDMERLISRVVGDGVTSQSTFYTYDARDRIKTVKDALNRVTTFTYDEIKVREQPTMITDPAGRNTYFEYDARDRLVKKTDAIGAQTKYTYDQRGNLTAVTDANGNVTSYAYDHNDRKIRETRPSVKTVSGTVVPTRRVQEYFYDPAGRLVREAFRSTAPSLQKEERSIFYSYDGLDRLIEKQLRSDRFLWRDIQDHSFYTYEEQLDAVLLKSANNGVANLGFENESAPPFLGTAFSVQAAQNGNPKGLIEGGFAIGRDVTGEIASVSRDGVYVLQKQYDPAGRLENASSGTFNSALTYDGFGRKHTVTHSTGEVGTFQYDLLNRITSISWTGGSLGSNPISEQLTYDPLTGNITNIQRENGAYSIAYDAIDQITSSTTTGSLNYNRAWTYDLLGNRLQDSLNGAGSFISNFLSANGVSSFLADLNGFGETVKETTGSTVKNFGYRADGLLNAVQNGSTSAAYYFDALGRRIVKAIDLNGQIFTQAFLHLENEDRILVARAGDGTLTTYIDANKIDEHLGEAKAGVGKGYFIGSLGSVLNSEAAGVARSFGVFGEPQSNVTISAFGSPVVYGFTGREFDPESGLGYNRYRQISFMTGRWHSQDPVGLNSGDLNLYRYVHNRGTQFRDPNGLAPAGSKGTKYEPSEFESQPEPDPAVNPWENFDNAAAEAEALFPDEPSGNSVRDAVRHCMASCLVAKGTGQSSSEVLGELVEIQGALKGQPAGEFCMDTHNNWVGRKLAEKGEKCSAACQEASYSGKLIKRPHD